MDNKGKMQLKYLPMLFFAAALIVIVWQSVVQGIRPLQITQEGLSAVGTQFGMLLLISLFVERSVEVLLSAWRSRGADKLDKEIIELQKIFNTEYIEIEKIEQMIAKDQIDNFQSLIEEKKNLASAKDLLDLKENETLELAISRKKVERTKYSAESRSNAIWFAVLLGCLISASGFQFLSNLIHQEKSGNPSSFFRTVDIIITGLVLAGGSDAITRIIKSFTEFFDSTRKSTKN